MADLPRPSRRRPATSARQRRGRGREQPGDPRGEAPRRSVISFGGLEIPVRLLGVSVLVAMLAAMLAPSVYQYLRQEQDYRDITARVASAEARNADMREELDLWKDPTYIAAQARERLGYARPGETQYSVVDPGGSHQGDSEVSAARADGPALPWVEVLTASLAEADHPDQ